MTMRKTNGFGLLLASLSLGIANSASAQESDLPGSFSGNVTLTTDYAYRGFTQANEDPAVQGGLDWESDNGFYVGTWGSNVNFGDGDEASIEIDVYGGYAGEIEGFSYDIGYIYYLYPGVPGAFDYDFWEIYGSVGYDFGPAALSLGLAYTPENFGNTNDGLYFQSGISMPLGEMFSVDANLNYYDVDPAFGEDYLDWSIGGTLSLDWFDADLRYIDTDIANCAGVCDARVVFSISRSF